MMGRSYTPRYAVHTFVPGCSMTPVAWRVAWRVGRSASCPVPDGKPTRENLERYVRRYEESCRPGGVNERIGQLFGEQIVRRAKIVDQFTGETVARYEQPMFQVVS